MPDMDRTPSEVTPTSSSMIESITSKNWSKTEVSLETADVSIDIENGPSKAETALIIIIVTAVTLLGSMATGVVVVQLPVIAVDIHLAQNLLFWPVSIYSLTCGCTLLLLSSITDVLGSRPMYLTGCALQCLFTMATGLSKNGLHLFLFRALSGVTFSMCLPSAVSIVTNTLPAGQRRNIAFAAMGAGQPIGFSAGLVLGGIFADTIGWRYGFYITAIINALLFVVAVFGLPRTRNCGSIQWNKLKTEIDWVGGALSSASLALISFCLASVTASTSNIRQPLNVVFLVVGTLLVPAFILWMNRQERLGQPAIIPNSLWKNRIFTCVCICVFLTWASFNAFETLMTLFFQDVQGLSALSSSLHLLPEPVCGIAINTAVGLLVHRIGASWLVGIPAAVAAVSPLLMAITSRHWSSWSTPLVSIILNPFGIDTLFTISSLVITSVYPGEKQALAGGVLQTIAQVGKAIGLAATAVVSSSVTASAPYADKTDPDALFKGYQASFWFCFGVNVLTLTLSVWGLRKIGIVGKK